MEIFWVLPVRKHCAVRVGAQLAATVAARRLADVLAGHAVLHRVTHRRPVLQRLHAAAQMAEIAVQVLQKALANTLPGRGVVRQQEELGEGRLWQLLIQRQVEPRRARADEGDMADQVRIGVQPGLQAPHFRAGGGQRAAFGQFQVDQQLGACRRREELLLDAAKAQQRQPEEEAGGGQHPGAPAQRPLQQAAIAAIKGALVGIRHRLAAGQAFMAGRGQQPVTQVGDKHHGDDPRQQQGNGHHLEQGAGVLAGIGGSCGNGQETRRRDQGAGQHREGGGGPGKGGGPDPLQALFELDRHHFHGNDRVVDQQRQGQHQGAERDLVQVDAEHGHHREGHRQHQRNGDRHHQAGAQAQGKSSPAAPRTRPGKLTRRNSPIDARTAAGWSATRCSSRPTGNS